MPIDVAMTVGSKARPLLVISALLWISAVCVGLRSVLNYQYTPGEASIAPVQWPSNTTVRLAPDRATLILFAHPHCPCTRATIGELTLIMAQCQGKVRAYMLFYRPAEFSERWERTDLWRSAAAIPGVAVLEDEDGLEAARFHAATSGQALLYDAQGRLVFTGGITDSRGHYGDNEGRDAIVSLLSRGAAAFTTTPVFGCSLLESNRRIEEAKLCHK